MAETMADAGTGQAAAPARPARHLCARRVAGLPDRHYGLDALAPIAAIKYMTDTRFGIGEEDLDAARIDAVHSEVKVAHL